jgi:hypothetical protein
MIWLYVFYIFFLIYIFFVYIGTKQKWLTNIYSYMYKQIDKFSENFTKESADENNHLEEYFNNKEELDNTTKLLVISKLKIKNYDIVLFNPFINHFFNIVKNKNFLITILEKNGEINIDRKK